MTDPVAIVSVASSATVAVAVPFINARLEQRRLDYEVTQERFGELRTLLDQSAEHLIDSLGDFATIAMRASGDPIPKRPLTRLVELSTEVFRDNTRLALRLGYQHGIVIAHTNAMQVLHGAEGKWRTQRVAPSRLDHPALGHATGAFLEAARKVVAVPARPRRRSGHPLRRWWSV